MRKAVVMGMVMLAAPAWLAAQGTPRRLTLAEALARADQASEAVGIARAGVKRADADRVRARSGLLPTIAGSATYTRTLATQFSGFASEGEPDSIPAPTNCGRFRPSPNLPLGERLDSLERGLDCTANGSGLDFSNLPFGRPNNWNFGLSGSLSLFDARTRGQIRAASAGRDAADAALAGERALAVLTAAQAYFDAQLATRLLAIADSSLAQAERAFEETRLARQVGNLAEFDLLRATVTRDNQRPVVIARRSQRDQALLRLKQVLDLPVGEALELTTPLGDTGRTVLPESVAGVTPDTAVAARAPVRAAEAALAASEGLLGASRGARLPTVTLSGTYAKIAFPDRVFSFDKFLTDAAVSVRLDVPLYTGGRSRADVLTAEAARDEAALRVRQARQQADRERADVGLTLSAAEATWLASQGTAEQATRAYAIAEVRFRNGLSTQIELSDARLLLQQADANRAQAARDLQLARLRAALLRDLPLGAGLTAPGGF